ncbi:MAG: hypothetical protein HC899_18065 [Leptolyngbyaceae cyanobacterium SM1_4_3]|nr:hypothetical protein [Leptolyngbyaceae cyanobacterium SM1_4_3]NJN89913.1 hypothetical protein [Leptolyngbyaceae cyanobacterium SL_5_14]
MKLDYGFTEYDTQESKVIFSWKSILDYDPNSSSLDLAVGDHYTIYKSDSGKYFLHCYHRIQRSMLGEVEDGQQYIQPLTDEDVCVYALLHNNIRLIESESLQEKYHKILEKIISFAPGEDVEVIRSKKDIYLDLKNIARQAESSGIQFGEDIKHDLSELQLCLGVGAYRSALAIGGRLLEISLKLFCLDNQIDFSDNWMVGQLIDKITQSGQYLDASLKSVWQIINQQRIVGVHAKSKAPIPSKEQAFMVSFAVIDTLKKVLKC